MGCSESRLAAFLAGELPPEEAEAVDVHLLTCEECWHAVREDRAGRAALELLVTPPPPGLAERVRLAVELEAAPSPASRRRRKSAMRRRLAALILAALVLVAGTVSGIVVHGGDGDPAPVAALTARAAAAPAPTGTAAGRGTWMALGGERVLLRKFSVEGIPTLVAMATHPFPMPAASAVVAGSSRRAWMASRAGGIGLYCVNAPAGQHSMLVAARMPAVQLPHVLAHLRLG